MAETTLGVQVSLLIERMKSSMDDIDEPPGDSVVCIRTV